MTRRIKHNEFWGLAVDQPDEVGGTLPPNPAPGRAHSEHRVDRLMRVIRVLVFVGVGSAGGFSSGGTVYRLAGSDDQPPTSEGLLRDAARLGLIAGAFLGAVAGLAVVPGIEENVGRALSLRSAASVAAGGLGGVALCVGAATLFWGAWSGLSGPGGQPPSLAAKYAGGMAGGVLTLALLWLASRWLRAKLAADNSVPIAAPGTSS